ncbi:hypothetical protein CYLTODRAFT_88136 [Cylindrobasidium torrendii FP15055 ss-10]|uniref:Uncharacterized protein n=1 Tax=Cylindrobasidium torrendii FP15055 ss-10 TaxID=1314674 RepID=A0A0D7B2I8_9AGAR|nr:hypothetical protein CYLTODRAFT_88136 [Cylindrobasidium torrendii FP15055 ss-10]
MRAAHRTAVEVTYKIAVLTASFPSNHIRWPTKPERISALFAPRHKRHRAPPRRPCNPLPHPRVPNQYSWHKNCPSHGCRIGGHPRRPDVQQRSSCPFRRSPCRSPPSRAPPPQLGDVPLSWAPPHVSLPSPSSPPPSWTQDTHAPRSRGRPQRPEHRRCRPDCALPFHRRGLYACCRPAAHYAYVHVHLPCHICACCSCSLYTISNGLARLCLLAPNAALMSSLAAIAVELLLTSMDKLLLRYSRFMTPFATNMDLRAAPNARRLRSLLIIEVAKLLASDTQPPYILALQIMLTN